jgi:hypothetical protein
LVSSKSMSSASPTCLRSLTSRILPLSLSRIDLDMCIAADCVSPRATVVSRCVMPAVPLVTGRCHCRGSEDDERRLRWR